jgi:hypothetical protein
MRTAIVVAGLGGGLMLTSTLVWSFNPETPVELRLSNYSPHKAALRYDQGTSVDVPPGDVWSLESDENGDHTLDIKSSQAPIAFRLSFNSAPWNAKSFSLRLDSPPASSLTP